MNFLYIPFFILLTLIHPSVFSQSFKEYTVANTTEGVSGLFGNCVEVDNNNNLWVGTRQGLSVYNGKTWTIYTTSDGLSGNDVKDILFDKDQNCWVATTWGISMYDGETWVSYTTADGLRQDYTNTLTLDGSNNIWAGHYGGLSYFNGETWSIYDDSNGYAYNNTREIIFDNNGTGWFATGEGLVCYKDGEWEIYTSDGEKQTESINCLEIDVFNKIWAGTYNGVIVINETGLKKYDKSDGLVYNNVHKIEATQNGHIWIGTSNGVSKFDGHKFSNYKKSDGLAYNIISGISAGTNGKVYFSTWRGISELDNEKWTTYLTTGLLDDQISNIVTAQNGDIWIGTNSGAVQITDSGWVKHEKFGKLGTYDVRVIAVSDKNEVWIASGYIGNGWTGGISHYDGKNWTSYNHKDHPKLKGFAVEAITCDKDGNTWFGGDREYVLKFDGENWSTYDLEYMVNSIAVDKKNKVWFGTYSNGLAMLNGDSWTFFTDSDGLADNTIKNLLVDMEDNLWIGTSNGLSKYDGENWATFTTDDGLMSNFINAISVDSNGNLWILTQSGISKYDGVNFENTDITNNQEELFLNCINTDSRNNIWVGTSKGITVLLEGTAFLNTSEENLYFEVEESGAGSFSVESNTSWHITTNSPWIKCHKTHGVDNYEIKVTCNENKSGAVRLGEIYVLGNGIPADTIKVEQGIADKNLDVPVSEFNITNVSDTTEKSFDITSNTSWIVASESNWIVIEKNSGNNSGTVSFKVAPNTTTRERTATINVQGTGANSASIMVVQHADTPKLSVATRLFDIPHSGTQVQVEITSNTYWSITSEDTWLELQQTWGFGNATVPFYANANTEITARNANLAVVPLNKEPLNITVNQEGSKTSGLGEAGNRSEFVYLDRNTMNIHINYSGFKEVKIYNLQGRLLTVSTKKHIDISSYNNGLYMIIIVREEGNHITWKVIK